MPLISCPDCYEWVPPTASNCPQCGWPLSRPRPRRLWDDVGIQVWLHPRKI